MAGSNEEKLHEAAANPPDRVEPADVVGTGTNENPSAAHAKKKERPAPETLEDIFYDVDAWSLVQGALWAFGIYARFKGILNEGYREAAGSRVEVVTPITDFARIREGSFLWSFGASPYAGDTLHQSPLVLALLSPLAGSPPPAWCLSFFFVLMQLMTAATIHGIACVYAASSEANEDCCMGGLAEGDEEEENKDFASAANDIEAVDDALAPAEEFTVCGRGVPALTALVYFVNPYCILTCVGLSTLVIDHLFLSAAILAAMQGRKRAVGQSFAIAVLLSPYSVSLLPPLCLLLKRSRRGDREISFAMSCWEMFKWTLLLQLLSCAVMATIVPPDRSWEWIKAVYAFTFTVPDLTPNVGLFWYFFIEIFDHFKSFFLFIFQYSILLYPLPLALRLRHRPAFLAVFTLGIVAIFKSYPSVGDAALYMPLLIIMNRSLSDMRRYFFLAQIFLFVSVLAPFFWDAWIVTGAGNANFYYGLTLAYGVAQVMILSEALLAIMRADKRARFRHYLAKARPQVVMAACAESKSPT